MCCCFTGHGLFNTLEPWFKKKKIFTSTKRKVNEKSIVKKKKKKKKRIWGKNFWKSGSKWSCFFLEVWKNVVKWTLLTPLHWTTLETRWLDWPPHSTPHVLIFLHAVWALYQELSEYVTVCRLSSSQHIIKVQNVFHVEKKEILCRPEVFSWLAIGDLLSHNKLNSRFLQRS